MASRKTRAGIAIALSCSLVFGGTSVAPAQAQIGGAKVADVAASYAMPRLNTANPFYVDGQHVVVFGNRYSMMEAGALAVQVAIGAAAAIAALIARAKDCGSSEVSGTELSSCLSGGAGSVGNSAVTVETSPEYEKGKPLSDLRVGKGDMEGFGPFSIGGKTYMDSLATTGSVSGWGTRYFEFSGEDVDAFGAVVGIQDQGGRSGPLPAKAVLVFRVDGKTVKNVEITAGKPQYVEHKFTERGKNISVEIVGMQADGSQMNAHGGVVIGTPRVW